MMRGRRPAWALGLAVAAVMLIPAVALANGPGPGDATLDQYHGWRLFALYGTAFVAGVGASLTPCVYPMIPIVLGVFGARGKDVSRRRSLALATLYVLGMGTTYAVLGTVFTLLGKQFSAVLAEPAVVIPMVLLYVVLAVSMFGAFDLQLPASWQARLNKIGGAGYGGAFSMGLVGGFTAAPCTGPFVAGLLTAVAKTGDVAIGASTLFVHAMGIGVLYWVLAVFASRLPKSGRWMEWVKSIGGIGLLAAALWFLRPIVPFLREIGSPSLVFAVGAIVLAGVGLASGAVHLSFHDKGAVRVRKTIAVALAVIGTFGVATWAVTPDRELPWQHDEAAAIAKAQAEHKGMMVDFSASWCTPCAELELTFAESGVYEPLVEHFVPLKIDVSEDNQYSRDKKARFGVTGTLPTVVFVVFDGDQLSIVTKIDQDTPDYLKPNGFMAAARPAIDEVAKRRATLSSR
jgi:thioredoxin:protein disulfide reductase